MDASDVQRHIDKAIDYAKANPTPASSWAQIALAEAALLVVEELRAPREQAAKEAEHDGDYRRSWRCDTCGCKVLDADYVLDNRGRVTHTRCLPGGGS
jgi:hypothetical protein